MKKLFFFSPEAHFSSVHGSVGTSPATKAEVNMARCPWEPCFSHPILFDSLVRSYIITHGSFGGCIGDIINAGFMERKNFSNLTSFENYL